MLNPIQDLRFALRMWRQNPGFTAVALLSLALGIGANTSIFSLMDALMLRHLPVRQPEQLVSLGSGKASGIFTGFPNQSPELFSHPFLASVRQENQVFSDVAAIESMRTNVHTRFSGESEPGELKIRVVSGNYFSMLGAGPAIGRVLDSADDRKPGTSPVAVLSYALWQRRFSRDAQIIGRTFTVNSTAFTIVGVASREFTGTVVDESPDVWIPLSMLEKVQEFLQDPRGMLAQSLWLMARLKPGVSLATAQAHSEVAYQQWLKEAAGPSPSAVRLKNMQKAHLVVYSASTGQSGLRSQFSDPLRILMVLVGLVLLIACVNIANLLLAQANGRQREIAVRLALGANRGRLICQLLSESMLLAFAGGALGVLLSWWGGQLLLTLVQNDPERIPISVGPNAHVLLFTFGLALLTGLFFGIAPSIRMTRVDLGPALKEGKGTAKSQARTKFGRILVAGQVALALFLMIGAGLFVRTLGKLEQANTGFQADRAILLQLDNESANITGQAAAVERRRLLDRLHSVPGVEAASFAMLTFNEGQWMTMMWPDNVPHAESSSLAVDGNRIEPEYFKALGVPLVMGRSFGPQDTPQSPRAVIVNESLARKLYPEQSPIGRRLISGLEKPVAYEIVGVLKDAKYLSVREKPRAMFFLDIDQEEKPDTYDDLVVRARGSAEALMPEIRAAIHAADPNMSFWGMMTLREAVGWSLGREKLLAELAGFFGVLALLLASIGLYGVMAYSVARRTNEIGIRMALGAQPAMVLRMILRESAVMVTLGFAVGIPAALVCGRYVASQLYGVQSNDVLTIIGSSAILLVVAVLAGFLPARRAAMLDPLTALREE